MGENPFIKGKLSDILSDLDTEGKTHEDIAKMLIGLPLNQEIGKDSFETIGKVIAVDFPNDSFTVYIF